MPPSREKLLIPAASAALNASKGNFTGTWNSKDDSTLVKKNTTF